MRASDHETEQRRELRKAFKAALKRHAKGTSWSTVQGALFRDFHGWFLSAPAHVWLDKHTTHIELHCKPMTIDPVFKNEKQTKDNTKQPQTNQKTKTKTRQTPSLV